MTIVSNTSRVSFTCDGTSTVFPVAIQAYLNTDFLVILTASGVSTTLVLNSDYTLTTSGTLNPTAWTLQTTTTYPSGNVLQIILNPPETQLTQYVQGQDFPSSAIQQVEDRAVQLSARRSDFAHRSIKAPDGDVSPAMELPTAVSRANLFLAFDASGNTIAVSPPAVLSPQVFGPGDIRNYGAVSGTDCAVAVGNAAAGNKQVIFPAGSWIMATTPSIPADTVLMAIPGAIFSGAGSAALGFTTGALIQDIEETSAISDFATRYVRRQANHTGGSAGVVANALNATTFVSASVSNFEWALLGVLFNSATAGQNVGGYLQGNRMTTTTGPTWGATVEVKDQSGQTNPTTGLIGLEVDCRANGTDANQQRIGLDVVISRFTPGTGTAMGCYAGIRVQNTGEGANAVAATGVAVWANCANGFDTSVATITSAAYKMASGQAISFDASNVNQMLFNGGGIIYSVFGVQKNALLASGGLAVNGTQVVGSQIAGYGTPTGGSHQPSFAAGSITLPNLAAAVAQLIIDLKAHGLLGS